MAVRVVTFEKDGVSVKLAVMSWKQAREHVEEGAAIRANPNTPDDAWMERTWNTVGRSILAATGVTDDTAPPLESDYDIRFINAAYLKILEESGLRPTEAEAAAAAKLTSANLPVASSPSPAGASTS